MSQHVVPNGAKIRELRKAKGLTQAALMEAAVISERTLRKIENSNHPIAQKKLQAISQRLGTSTEDLSLTSLKQTDSVHELQLPWNQLFELRREDSASKLLEALTAGPFYDPIVEYDVRGDISTDEAGRIECVLKAVHAITQCTFRFKKASPSAVENPEPFADIRGRAELHQAIQRLQDAKIHLFVGSYWVCSWDERRHPERDYPTYRVKERSLIFRIVFSRSERSTLTDEFDPGVVSEGDEMEFIDGEWRALTEEKTEGEIPF